MNIRPVLLSLATALALSGCGGESADDHGHDHPPRTADHAADAPQPTAPAAPVTEAIYGDEVPVELAPAAPVDDHGHAHNADGSHVDEGDDHGHAHDDDAADHDHGGHPHDAGDEDHGH